MGITSSEVFTTDKAAAMATLKNSVTTLPLPLLLFLQLFISSSFAAAAIHPLPLTPFNRSSFPPGFVFGAASSAYQYEGAAFEDGKGASVWDTFTHKSPERIIDKSNGDVANDFYHRYKEDVKLLKYVGLDAFRLSISWPRILPRGKLSGGVNRQGIAFYNNVINELLANGVTPFVTLFHWDTPQALEDEYGGFLSGHIIDDFKDFVDVCFKEFGDRVKYWITLNEPVSYANAGYDGGLAGHFAPGRCSDRSVCPAGDSATEPYIVAHHLLLSHAIAVKLYKEKYQGVQKGEIGITLVTHWFLPYTNSKLDAAAVGRSLDFVYGWFISPVTYGDYPSSMRSIVGHRLPKFTKEQSAMLKGSFDFLGLNYYTAFYAAHVVSTIGNLSNSDDRKANFISERNGVSIGEPTGVGAFHVYPKGLYDLLVYTKEKYNNPKIYITENGIGDQNNATTKESITDPQRITFYHRHLQAALKAMKDGVNLKGFIAWSFLDVFEWNSGFTLRFGLCYVDWKNGLKRIPKQSAIWFRNFLGKK